MYFEFMASIIKSWWQIFDYQKWIESKIVIYWFMFI